MKAFPWIHCVASFSSSLQRTVKANICVLNFFFHKSMHDKHWKNMIKMVWPFLNAVKMQIVNHIWTRSKFRLFYFKIWWIVLQLKVRWNIGCHNLSDASSQLIRFNLFSNSLNYVNSSKVTFNTLKRWFTHIFAASIHSTLPYFRVSKY